MSLIKKLILLFSMLAVLTTGFNTFYLYNAQINSLNESTYTHLSSLGSKMLVEIEQYVQLMNYAMDELVSNTEFMDALYTASKQTDTDDIGESVAAQNVLSRTLFRSPLRRDFYLISVYSRNGFFLSNRFETTNTLSSYSEEAIERLASLSYLSQVDEKPFVRHLIGPHKSPWLIEDATSAVFTAIRAVIWRGEFIGYMEVSASVDKLASIFFMPEVDGLLVQAILDDGNQLFRYYGDDIVYAGLNSDGMTHYFLEDGSERLVVDFKSSLLGLKLYVSQDMRVYSEQARTVLKRCLLVSFAILLVTIGLIVLISISLTSSMRRFVDKMKIIPADSISEYSSTLINTMVTRKSEQEVHQIELSFNKLISRLLRAHHTEMALREGVLQAQLSTLQMQINPHFIYNTLNIIGAKGVESGNEEILKMCDQFAQMLRYATDTNSKTASLGDELQNAQRYLMLAKARYEDQLRFDISVPEQFYNLQIPKLTLQPIVENAMTHGFANYFGQRVVQIDGTVEGGNLCLVIRDNGNGFDPDVLVKLREVIHDACENKELPESFSPDGHLGLINTYLRLIHYSHKRIQMKIYNDCGAVVELIFPRIEKEV